MTRSNPMRSLALAASVCAGLALAGCASENLSDKPPMPISMQQASAFAQQKQVGINVSRQFAGMWQGAKQAISDHLTNCVQLSSARHTDGSECFSAMHAEALTDANRFSGLYANGLSPEQAMSFARARQAAVTYFQLVERFASGCVANLQQCGSPQNATRQQMLAAKARVDRLLGATAMDQPGSASAYEAGQVNSGLSGMSSTPNAVSPAAQMPSLEQRPVAQP